MVIREFESIIIRADTRADTSMPVSNEFHLAHAIRSDQRLAWNMFGGERVRPTTSLADIAGHALSTPHTHREWGEHWFSGPPAELDPDSTGSAPRRNTGRACCLGRPPVNI